MDKILIQQGDFSIKQELDLLRADDDTGAIASFVGQVRNNDCKDLQNMVIEHYPGMTEKTIEGILKEARTRWSVNQIVVIHRVGILPIGAQIVLVLVSAKSRRDAFSVCWFVMDFLKTDAPFWKKEKSLRGECWVKARFKDKSARERWAET